MIIDQTKSFVVNSDGTSISYYDPTVRMTSETTSTSTTKGGSLNLGAFAGALGVGGVLGTLANGVNVGGANTVGHSTTNATYFSDQPQISLAPKGNGVMSKEYLIGGLGTSFLSNPAERNSTYTPDNSYCKFRVCITYSIDNGQTFDKIVTDFYANSWIVSPVRVHGKVNDALHTILSGKPDAIHESWWLLYFKDNIRSYYDIKTKLSNRMVNGMITDYR